MGERTSSISRRRVLALGAGAALSVPSALTIARADAGPSRIGAWRGHAGASADAPDPPREFRGVWVATVANIDWPSKPGVSAGARRAEMLRVLDGLARANVNAVLLQVRPSCDAIYASELEPWSEFVTGAQGQPPADGGDPLAEWIEASHSRGLELHAWFNPFRARHFEAKTPNAPGHVSRSMPDAWRRYGQYEWLDPGSVRARAHSLAVIADVARRYAIDGVHLDDYFYPYPEKGLPFPDDDTYARFRAMGGTLSRSDWRRSNIDAFVRELHDTVRSINPALLVSLSPFGIWRPGHPPGIEGFDAYEHLAADARKWMREGWLDASMPQLYWPIASRAQSFERLLDWWLEQNTRGRHLWPGLYLTRVVADGSGWAPEEILSQIDRTRSRPGARGVVLFSAKGLVEDPMGVGSRLAQRSFASPAVVPASPWLGGALPRAPVVHATGESSRVRLTLRSAEGRAPLRWVVDARHGSTWRAIIRPGGAGAIMLDRWFEGTQIDRIVARALGSGGRISESATVEVRQAGG